MAGNLIQLYRNRSAQDTVLVDNQWMPGYIAPTPESLNFDYPGYVFTKWTTSRDGTGTSLNPGDELTTESPLYAQWAEETYPAGYLDGTGLHRVWNKVKAIVPTKTSDLTNDSGYLTLDTLPIWDGGVT